MAKKKTEKSKRATKYQTELVNPEMLKQDIDDVIVRLQEMKTRTDELKRLQSQKANKDGVDVYGMPSWRKARESIDAVAASLLKSVGEIKKCLE